jgi:hypothetical protein
LGSGYDLVSFAGMLDYLAPMHMQSLAAPLLIAGCLVAAPAAAQTTAPLVGGVVNSGPDQHMIAGPPAGFAEAAVASCAGGAAIGYLVVLAVGAPSPLGTAALFCGLSVAATVASAAAVWTWDAATSSFR